MTTRSSRNAWAVLFFTNSSIFTAPYFARCRTLPRSLPRLYSRTTRVTDSCLLSRSDAARENEVTFELSRLHEGGIGCCNFKVLRRSRKRNHVPRLCTYKKREKRKQKEKFETNFHVALVTHREYLSRFSLRSNRV